MLSDAQTSGGLLISVPENNSSQLLKMLNKSTNYLSTKIGHLNQYTGSNIIVINE